MIDLKHKTFLEVCRLKSFTKASESLYITQPAVSQHIQYLEELYGGELITFIKRKFELTDKGEKLYNFLISLHVDCQRAIEEISKKSKTVTNISFGATLTIGEYVMPSILKNIIKLNPLLRITMLVDNTKVLLKKLDEGSIQFALIEGSFNRDRYASKVLSVEPFIAVTSPENKLLGEQRLENLCSERLITREKGSGTRMVLEQILDEYNLNIDHFSGLIEVGNVSTIKELVMEKLGITFLYKIAVLSELQKKSLVEIPIKNFSQFREFNFVFLKSSQFTEEYLHWYNVIKAYM